MAHMIFVKGYLLGGFGEKLIKDQDASRCRVYSSCSWRSANAAPKHKTSCLKYPRPTLVEEKMLAAALEILYMIIKDL